MGDGRKGPKKGGQGDGKEGGKIIEDGGERIKVGPGGGLPFPAPRGWPRRGPYQGSSFSCSESHFGQSCFVPSTRPAV